MALEEFIWKVTDQYMEDTSGTRLNIEIENPDKFQTTFININSGLMEIAISNLISNAYKFSQKEVEMRININKDFVTISVIDQGIGIAPQDIEKITLRFTAAKMHTVLRVWSGACHCLLKLSEQNRGELLFKSVLGIGTTSIVKIPVVF